MRREIAKQDHAHDNADNTPTASARTTTPTRQGQNIPSRKRLSLSFACVRERALLLQAWVTDRDPCRVCTPQQ